MSFEVMHLITQKEIFFFFNEAHFHIHKSFTEIVREYKSITEVPWNFVTNLIFTFGATGNLISAKETKTDLTL